MPAPIETEFKLRATAPLDAEQVDAALSAAGVRVRHRSSTAHTDVYLDDAAGTLARHGIGLRLRVGSDGRVLACKSAGTVTGALHRREERAHPWPGDAPPDRAAMLPEPLRDAVEPFVLGRPLAPVLTLDVRREVRVLALGELAVDTVTAAAGERRAMFVEVELEVDAGQGDAPPAGGDDPDAAGPDAAGPEDGPSDPLAAASRLAERLERALPVSPAVEDKPTHAAQLLGLGAVSAGLPAGEAQLADWLSARLQEHLSALRTHAAGVRCERGPEEVHQLRVHLRHMRVLAGAFAEAWRPEDAALLRETLRAWGRSLGEPRERDVVLEMLPDLVASLPAPLQHAAATVAAGLRDRRDKAYARVRTMLRDPAHVQDMAQIESLCTRAAMPTGAAALPAAAAAPRELWRTARRLRRRIRRLGRQPGLPELHEVRLSVKRLRMLADEVAGVRGEDAGKARRRLLRAQSRLGSMCDCEVAIDQHLELLGREDLPRPAVALAGALAGLLEGRLAAARRRALRAARRLDRASTWRRFGGPGE